MCLGEHGHAWSYRCQSSCCSAAGAVRLERSWGAGRVPQKCVEARICSELRFQVAEGETLQGASNIRHIQRTSAALCPCPCREANEHRGLAFTNNPQALDSETSSHRDAATPRFSDGEVGWAALHALQRGRIPSQHPVRRVCGVSPVSQGHCQLPKEF